MYWKRLVIRSGLILLGLMVLLISLVPAGLRVGLAELAKRQGAAEALIDNIDLNPLSGRFRIEGVYLRFEDAPAFKLALLETDLSMRELFEQRIVVEKLLLNGLQANIRRDKKGVLWINGWSPDSLPQPSSASDKETREPLAWAVESLVLQNLQIHYREPGLEQPLVLQSLKLEKLRSWQPRQPAGLDFVIELQQQARLQGDLELTPLQQSPAVKGQLQLTRLPLETYRKFLPQAIDRLAARLDLELQLDLQLPDNRPDQLQGQIEHRIRLQDLQLAHEPLKLDLQSFNWQADARLQGINQLQVSQGKLELSSLQLDDPARKFLLARFKHLLIDGLQLQADRSLTFEELKLTSLETLAEASKTPLLQLEELSLRQLRFDRKLEITEVDVASPRVEIEIDEQKKLPALEALEQTVNQLQATRAADTPDPEQGRKTAINDSESPEENPLEFAIDRLQLTRPGRIDILDRSVSPNFKTQLLLKTLTIRNLQRKQPADFELLAQQGDYSLIQLQGSGLLLDPQQRLKLKAVIKQLDLPPLTSYTSKALGYGVKSGVLGSNIDLGIEKNRIDALIKLDIDAIDVIETNPETAAELNSAAGISIDLALSTLKDSDGRIRLELPVKGDLTNPDFRLQKIFNKALGKAMQGATLAYLKHTLQPFGSLITLYQLGKAAAGRVALPALTFQPGSLELAEGQQALLNKVIELMKKRAGLKIKACGLASTSDREALLQQLKEQTEKEKKTPPADDEKLKQSLFDLAEQRAAWVKKQLVASGIAAERVLNCLSRVDIEKTDLSPQVQLLL